ncbi:MAG: class I poly(R)-hydroxyalkanoic acid synthase [Burkholderiales bacterium]
MADAPQPKTPDPQEVQRTLAEISQRSARVVGEFLKHQPYTDVMRNVEDLGIDKAFVELGRRIAEDPMKLVAMQKNLWEDYVKLWTATVTKARGETGASVREPAKGDARFKSELWQNNFLFDYIKQSYLIAADHIQRAVAGTDGLDPTHAKKVKFFTRQYIDALAPTNFAATNPDVLKATVESGGQNLLSGLKNLLRDLERGHGKLAISMTDYEAFKLGENVASTAGKVVYQNDLMQLLQFEPTTPQVDRTPLVIVPPWINKYYILDLRARNSFIKWATDRGLTVFVISWVNPDERQANKTFHDYLFEGPLAAMDAVREATGEEQINLIGYCLGGTLTACLMAWLRAKGQSRRVKSVTYFTTMIDFTDPGELGVFVDEQTVDNLEKRMAQRGYLEGEEMAGTFNLLRDNDLVWSFVVNNYLLGKEPFPFDLLYWNSDATRMPAKMQTFYLRNMYIRNLLSKPGALEVGGEKMDLSKVDTPTYFISTMEDHIAPWKSTYMGARLFGGPVRFVLGGSGHIAGIVNPPVAQKYCYWTNGQQPESADAWLASADRHEGSWWDDWGTWVSAFGGGRVPARVPGDGKLRVIEAAPGSYAKLRLDSAKPGAGAAAAPVAPAHASAPAPAPAEARSPVDSPVAAKPPEPVRAADTPKPAKAKAPKAVKARRETAAGKPAAPAPRTVTPDTATAPKKSKAPKKTSKKASATLAVTTPKKSKTAAVPSAAAAAISAIFRDQAKAKAADADTPAGKRAPKKDAAAKSRRK